MSVIYPTKEDVVLQINKTSGSEDCVLVEDDGVLYPFVKVEERKLYFSYRLYLVIVLFLNYTSCSNELRRFLMLYQMAQLFINDGHYYKARLLINELKNIFASLDNNTFNAVIANKTDLRPIIGVLIAHELCHYRFYVYQELGDKEIDEIVNELKDFKFKGVRGFFVSRLYFKMLKNKSNVEELVCDKYGAKYLSELYENEEIGSDEMIDISCQVMRFLSYYQQFNNMFSLSRSSILKKPKILDIIRVGNFAISIASDINSDSDKLVASMKSEIYSYYDVLTDMCRFFKSDLSLAALLRFENDKNSDDYKDAVKNEYYELSASMLQRMK